MVPEAFVYVRAVTVPDAVRSSLGVKTPAMVTFPPLSTLNLDEEFTCRSMKLPLYPEAGFAPRKVPEAELPVTKLFPRSTRVEVEDSGWFPPTENLDQGEVVERPRRFVVLSKKKFAFDWV